MTGLTFLSLFLVTFGVSEGYDLVRKPELNASLREWVLTVIAILVDAVMALWWIVRVGP